MGRSRIKCSLIENYKSWSDEALKVIVPLRHECNNKGQGCLVFRSAPSLALLNENHDWTRCLRLYHPPPSETRGLKRPRKRDRAKMHRSGKQLLPLLFMAENGASEHRKRNCEMIVTCQEAKNITAISYLRTEGGK